MNNELVSSVTGTYQLYPAFTTEAAFVEKGVAITSSSIAVGDQAWVRFNAGHPESDAGCWVDIRRPPAGKVVEFVTDLDELDERLRICAAGSVGA